jgi:hypothetical protein
MSDGHQGDFLTSDTVENDITARPKADRPFPKFRVHALGRASGVSMVGKDFDAVTY